MNAPRITLRSTVLTFALAGCAAGAPSLVAPPREASSLVSAGSSSPSLAGASGTSRAGLTRALVEQTVSQGLGVFLSRVSVSPVLRGARFVGFRLEAAEDLEAWRAAGADLRVGDVIQRINGQVIERPEQAMWAFDQLRIARGLEVVGLRGEASFRVYSPIVDAR
jgi:hypothetical protein